MNIKRYTYRYAGDGELHRHEEPEGRYVLHAGYADLEARHNALVEAVAWERECCQDIRPLVAWADLYARHGEDYVDGVAEDLRAIQAAARAEVDRLIANETAADCKGEG
jgi:hypothetical protein